jgi:hypothetical protein
MRAFQFGFGRHGTGVCSLVSVHCEDPGAWRDLERGAPRLAMLAMASLNAARVALLGTLRRDGSPRISPIEPYLVEGQLLIGAMAWSQKAADGRTRRGMSERDTQRTPGPTELSWQSYSKR